MADGMAPGAGIAHYRIVSLLGQGGMGAVYLADDTRLGRRVALKILPPEVAADPERMQRFVQEARLASALTHPNVATIYEIGQDKDLWFLAMEFVEGRPLSGRIQQGPLKTPEIVAIGLEIADALDDAHSKGIVHRDIKPANLMLTQRGHVKILDFGLAKQAATPNSQETQLMTSVGVVMGTVAYMSPEQALGRDVDARTDIFSLGVVLYEMATGRIPFSGANAQETMAHLLQSMPEATARFNYDVPQELDRVIRKCLEKDPSRRYQSARELMVDLKNLDRDTSSGRAPAVAEASSAATRRLKAILVDDEELARQLLREYLNAAKGVDIVAECANGFEAVKAISEQRPDLVFLDVQMPKLDGFEVLELIGREVAVIFVTAYDQYAMKAFDAHAVDYLLKPFSQDRLEKALERARQRLGQKLPPPTELSREARPPEQHLQRIVVKDGARVHIIPVDTLDYAEAQDDYIALHSQRKSYLKQQTISSLEAGLDPERFVRIHRSIIVNLERIAKIEPYAKDSRVAVLSDGTQLPVSRAGYDRLRTLLGEKL